MLVAGEAGEPARARAASLDHRGAYATARRESRFVAMPSRMSLTEATNVRLPRLAPDLGVCERDGVAQARDGASAGVGEGSRRADR